MGVEMSQNRPNITITVFIGGLSILTSILFGPVVERISSPLINNSNLPYLLYFFVVFLIAFSLYLFSDAHRAMNHLEQNTSDRLRTLEDNTTNIMRSVESGVNYLADRAGEISRIRIMEYTDALDDLTSRINGELKEALIFNNYHFDWESREPKYSRNDLDSPERHRTYVETHRELTSSLNDPQCRQGRRYCRIVRVPEGHNLSSLLDKEPYLRDEVELLSELNDNLLEFACIRVSDTPFYNTFVIIDQTYLYLDIGMRKTTNENNQQEEKAFVLVMEDKDSDFIRSLREFHLMLQNDNASRIYTL